MAYFWRNKNIRSVIKMLESNLIKMDFMKQPVKQPKNTQKQSEKKKIALLKSNPIFHSLFSVKIAPYWALDLFVI